MHRRAVALAAVALVGVTTACLNDITGTRPLSFDLSADVTTPTVGQDVTFTFEATGTGLAQVVIDFGDGVADTIAYGLAPLEVGGLSVHAYTATGAYTVRGEATAVIGKSSAELTVTVN